jgi:hypothetical protein
MPVIKSSENVSKWVDANDENVELLNLPWGFGQPNGRSFIEVTL